MGASADVAVADAVGSGVAVSVGDPWANSTFSYRAWTTGTAPKPKFDRTMLVVTSTETTRKTKGLLSALFIFLLPPSLSVFW